MVSVNHQSLLVRRKDLLPVRLILASSAAMRPSRWRKRPGSANSACLRLSEPTWRSSIASRISCG